MSTIKNVASDQQAKEKMFDIVNGPNVDLLFDACRYAYAKETHISVKFDVAFGHTEPEPSLMKIGDFRIVGISHEDGSGDSLLLEGFCRAAINTYIGAERKACKFNAYYKAKTRKGWIKLEEY